MADLLNGMSREDIWKSLALFLVGSMVSGLVGFFSISSSWISRLEAQALVDKELRAVIVEQAETKQTMKEAITSLQEVRVEIALLRGTLVERLLPFIQDNIRTYNQPGPPDNR